MVVDIGPVRRPDEDDLCGPGDAAPGPFVAVGNAGTEMVTHGRTHREIGMDLDAVFREVIGRPDPGPQQHPRGEERTGRDHDFVGLDLFAGHQDDTFRASPVDRDRRDLGVRANFQIVPRAHPVGQVGEARRDPLRILVSPVAQGQGWRHRLPLGMGEGRWRWRPWPV